MPRLFNAFQDRAAGALGLEPTRRTPLVHAMLHRAPGDAAGYWLQILIATTLATLGLALGSTAVVIGAMLIAPLMRPIVELAMGLATGSTPLVFRTGVRAVVSAAVVVATSATFSHLLPFHEVTSELLARTAPTLLDLFIAAACALAGAYAVVISSSDVATTAAGTSIGISLVPPLCTVGYGLSTGDMDMAKGAALLFTANVTGIVTVATAVFVLLGFGQVDIRQEEQTLDEDENIGFATRLGRRLSTGARLGALSRIVIPLALLGAVALPLVRAVEEMTRRTTVRQRVEELLGRKNGSRVVQYSLDQTSRPVVLRVVIVGDAPAARRLEGVLHRQLRNVGVREAAISVWAVPDALALSALSARLDDVPAVAPVPAVEAPPPRPLGERIRSSWPASAGELLEVWTASDGGFEGSAVQPHARIWHLAPALGDAGRELLARAVAVDSSTPMISERVLATIEEPADRGREWLAPALDLLAASRDVAGVQLCVTLPAPPARRAREDSGRQLFRTIFEQAAAQDPNVSIVAGDRWQITPQRGACQPPAAAP